MAKTVAFIRHSVADYGAWRAVYDEVEPLRQQHRCTGHEVTVGPDDKQDVFIIHRFDDLADAQAFFADADLKAAMERAGVAGPPRIELTVEA